MKNHNNFLTNRNATPSARAEPLCLHTSVQAPYYLEPFFVGLFEGDGTIYLGKSGKRSHGIFQINLKHNLENDTMLRHLGHIMGGRVTVRHIKNGNNQIVWTASSQKDVKNILRIFEKYPLLTSRKICQHNYLKQCMVDRSWDYHLQTRDLKYEDQQKLVEHYKQNFKIPDYFGPWLSGFFEAEGSFKSTHFFMVDICQNVDWYLLHAIKCYWNSHHKIGLRIDLRQKNPPKHYRLSISSKPTIKRIIEHFETYPLLGYKKVSYDLFCSKFKQSTCHAVTSL